MLALSVRQPWANLIVSGAKSIETRTWKTKYRGPILLVSSKSPNIMPAGFALAIAELIDCRPMIKGDELKALCHVYPNANSWVLRNISRIRPFRVQGKLGIYNVEMPRACTTSIQTLTCLDESSGV